MTNSDISIITPPRAMAVDVAALTRLSLLYACLVGYGLFTVYLLKTFLSPVYGYVGFRYDADREWLYSFLALVTPLAILFGGTRIRAASQCLFAAFAVFLLLPTPIYFAAHVPVPIFLNIYAFLWITTAMLAWCSRASLARPLAQASSPMYRLLIWGLVAFFAISLSYGATQNFQLVSFADIYKLRHGEEYASNFIIRVVHMYIFSLGGLLLALALAKRRYLLALGCLVVFGVCYMESQLKAAAIAPFWIIYIFLTHRYFFKDDLIKFYLTLLAPFLMGGILAVLFPSGTYPLGSSLAVFGFTNLVNYRLYGIPNLAFPLYYDFFALHPLTYWSHITGINMFVHYAYGDNSIAQELDYYYGRGNFNASFISMDALGSYGYQALPLVGAVMGAVFVMLNTASKGIKTGFMALVMIMPSILFLERPMATSLLTGGVIFLIPYLALMPRDQDVAQSNSVP